MDNFHWIERARADQEKAYLIWRFTLIPLQKKHKGYTWNARVAIHRYFNVDLTVKKLVMHRLDEEPMCGIMWLKGRVNKDEEFTNDEIRSVGDKLKEVDGKKIFSGKLKTRWSGPFTITRVFLYGTIELSQPNDPNFKTHINALDRFTLEHLDRFLLLELDRFLLLEVDRFLLLCSRSVPTVVIRSVPAVETRSVPAVETRSVPVVVIRSVPAVETRSVPAVVF
nr:reverse transcriptase domain-containing protein [Tanacetum cinerariifolium]